MNDINTTDSFSARITNGFTMDFMAERQIDVMVSQHTVVKHNQQAVFTVTNKALFDYFIAVNCGMSVKEATELALRNAQRYASDETARITKEQNE